MRLLRRASLRNRLIGLLLGAAIAGVVLAFQSTRVRPQYFDLLPENCGSLDVVALQYTKASAHDLRPAYLAFLSAIDPTTKVVAVCGDKADAADFETFLHSFPNSHPERAQVVVVGAAITGWCKDRFLVTSSNPAILLAPKPPITGVVARSNDALVAGAIARAFPDRYREVQAATYFDSGDIVATQTRLIVSDNLWRKNDGNREHDVKAMNAFDRGLAAEFNRKVVHLHGVPDHHIGMFAVPLDDRTVIVGDPDLAKPFWNSKLDDAYGKAHFSAQISELFNQAASQLKANGFRVIRVPTVYFAPQEFLSYTNAVLETRNGRRIVYMPWYDVPRLDNAGRAAYESAGWEVRPIPVRTLYKYRGTIGCLINVLNRS